MVSGAALKKLFSIDYCKNFWNKSIPLMWQEILMGKSKLLLPMPEDAQRRGKHQERTWAWGNPFPKWARILREELSLIRKHVSTNQKPLKIGFKIDPIISKVKYLGPMIGPTSDSNQKICRIRHSRNRWKELINLSLTEERGQENARDALSLEIRKESMKPWIVSAGRGKK